MAKGYVVAQISVTDADAYVAKVQPIIDMFGGRFIVRGGQSVSYEGNPPGDRTVVIEFPSYQAAMDWYHSEEYAEAKAMRMAASTSVQTIVEGV